MVSILIVHAHLAVILAILLHVTPVVQEETTHVFVLRTLVHSVETGHAIVMKIALAVLLTADHAHIVGTVHVMHGKTAVRALMTADRAAAGAETDHATTANHAPHVQMTVPAKGTGPASAVPANG